MEVLISTSDGSVHYHSWLSFMVKVLITTNGGNGKEELVMEVLITSSGASADYC